jgi:hypothetical protein
MTIYPAGNAQHFLPKELLQDAASPAERAPGALLPVRAAAHRADRKRSVDSDAVTAFRAVEFALYVCTGADKLHIITGGLTPHGSDITHFDPLRSDRSVTSLLHPPHTLHRANK